MSQSDLPAQVTIVDHPLIQIRLTELRAKGTDTASFRRCLHEIGSLMVFEICRSMETVPVEIETPLTTMTGEKSARPTILIPILRAGLGMLQGVMNVMPEAKVGHIGMYRDEDTLEPKSYYCNLPDAIGDADVLLIDPMLATGNSSVEAANQIIAAGAKRVSFVCLVACPEGVKYFAQNHPDIPIYTAAVDPELNAKSYIVPGLGDAGDRYFGTFD